ncbi:MAG: cobalt ECF transporter T component CbiQ [Anaerolineales bacterium]|jgi:cobalt/nickel transport system permease protein
MHVDLFDRYQSGQSFVHRLDPRVKVVITLVFILSNVLLPDGAWIALLLSWIFVLVASTSAGLGLGYAVKRSFVALPFFLAAVSAIFAVPGRAIGGLEIGPWNLVATQEGLVRFGSIVARSWISVQMAILLTATTQFPDLVHALRHLHVPQVLVSIIAFMYRYLFVLSDEAMRLLRAREARSAQPLRGNGRSIGWRARVAGNMAGQLFLRSYERSDRIYAAMQARGYSGQLLTIHPHEMHARDWILGSLAVILLLSFQLIARI